MITAELDDSIVEITNSTDNVVIDNANIIAGYDNSYNVDIEDLSDLDITVAKKEYTIVGDDIYIPQLYDDTPQWMKDLVGLVVDVSMTTNSTKLINDMNAMLQEFAVSYVPLNQYTQSILDLGNEDMRLNALIETLNSNFSNGLSNANAQIIDLQMTKASKDEVIAQVIQTLAAQLSNPNSNLGATVARLDQAIANEQAARALSMSVLTASLSNISEGVEANAEVIKTALAYVGIDEAGASTGTGLSAYLEASDGTIGGADSQLANSIRVTAEGVESKWAYNSTVNINGKYAKSGFGLTAFSGAGTEANPYTSEFWIDATKLKFTNSNATGSTAPFTIDASGTTPQIKFNGVVEFSNVAGTTALYNSINTAQSTANTANNNAIARTLPNEVAAAVNNNVTTINGSKITAGSVTADQIAANSISADRLTSTNGHSTVWNGGGLVSANFNGNPVGNIGDPTQGFRLSSNAAGTKTDPNIYGAYIKGGIVEGSNLWLSTPAGYAKVQHLDMLYYNFNLSPGPATYTLYSPYIELVSPTYGSGYMPNRVFSLNSSIISIITTGAINSTAVGINLSLLYSADGGAWTKLDQFSGNLPGVNVIYYGLCPLFSNTLRVRLSITYINTVVFPYDSTASAALTLINQN